MASQAGGTGVTMRSSKSTVPGPWRIRSSAQTQVCRVRSVSLCDGSLAFGPPAPQACAKGYASIALTQRAGLRCFVLTLLAVERAAYLRKRRVCSFIRAHALHCELSAPREGSFGGPTSCTLGKMWERASGRVRELASNGMGRFMGIVTILQAEGIILHASLVNVSENRG